MVYGNFQENEVTEESKCNPIEIWLVQQSYLEKLQQKDYAILKIPWTIVRPSAVFGPTDMNNRISQLIIDKALQKETINIYGKDEKLDFTYEKFISGMLVRLIKMVLIKFLILLMEKHIR